MVTRHHFTVYKNAESLYGTPETNFTLYVNYTQLKKKTLILKAEI